MNLMPRLPNLALFLALASLSDVMAQEASPFDWNSIEPAKNFSWVDCYTGFQCARFQVPLDYSVPDNNQFAAIAVVKLAAQVPHSNYGGPIFLNPGGPGGSGVTYALESGPILQSFIGTQFDIIGFDPRGVNFSTPKISIFETEEERFVWSLQETVDLNSTTEALPEAWARYQVFGQLAESRNSGTLDFVTTGDVARDMLAMAEALGQEKVQYYGVSYGTVLGAVFASMFPDRVGRVVIDGCVDMEGWFTLDLASMMEDTDKTMQAFFDSCHSAGPENCAFYAASPSEIEANLNEIYASLRSQPLPVFSADTYGVLTYDQLRIVILAALYFPTNFPALAQGLAELQGGNGTSIYQAAFSGLTSQDASVEAPVAIHCSDANPSDADASELREYMSNINSSFAGMGAVPVFINRCTGWKIHPENRFKGPAGAANTSFPLLVIGNTADPITPLSAAKKASDSFPGSVLLTQDSPGHTSGSTFSSCTLQHIAAYFSNGTLPEKGTVCSLDEPLFPSTNGSTTGKLTRSVRSLTKSLLKQVV